MPPRKRQQSKKNQSTRHVATARCDAAAERDVLMAFLRVVFLEGRNPRGGNRAPFVRAWFDARTGEVVAYIHKLSTAGGLRTKLQKAGIELTSLRAGEASVVGPLEARSGLTRGQHTVPGHDHAEHIQAAFASTMPETVLARLENCKRYEYVHQGVYFECGTPCARIAHLPADPVTDPVDAEPKPGNPGEFVWVDAQPQDSAEDIDEFGYLFGE
jgi:hypothetical protein